MYIRGDLLIGISFVPTIVIEFYIVINTKEDATDN